jgi:hypothetical protein
MSNEYLQSILALSSPTQGSFLDKTLASISDYQTRSTKNANDRNAFNAQAAGERARDMSAINQLNEVARSTDISTGEARRVLRQNYAKDRDTAMIENKAFMNSILGQYGKKGLNPSHFYTESRRYGDESYDHYSLTPEGARIVENAKAANAKALQDSYKAWFEKTMRDNPATQQAQQMPTPEYSGYGLPYSVNTNTTGNRITRDGFVIRSNASYPHDEEHKRPIGFNPITGGYRLLPGRDVMDMGNFAYSLFNPISLGSSSIGDGSWEGYKPIKFGEFYNPDVDQEYQKTTYSPAQSYYPYQPYYPSDSDYPYDRQRNDFVKTF